jgi:hypothetical protein
MSSGLASSSMMGVDLLGRAANSARLPDQPPIADRIADDIVRFVGLRVLGLPARRRCSETTSHVGLLTITAAVALLHGRISQPLALRVCFNARLAKVKVPVAHLRVRVEVG